jgi:hypothetical protein
VSQHRIPTTRRDPERPYFGSALARAGQRVAKVVAPLRCATCGDWVVGSSSDWHVDELCLDRCPVADGAYVVVQNAHGGQKAIPYDEAIHAGWPRYAAHVCSTNEK